VIAAFTSMLGFIAVGPGPVYYRMRAIGCSGSKRLRRLPDVRLALSRRFSRRHGAHRSRHRTAPPPVVSGIAKTYLIAQNGRQATIRYARTGDILGSVSVYDSKPNLPGSPHAHAHGRPHFQNECRVRARDWLKLLVLIRDLQLEYKGIGDLASGLDA
jgi:hypothetical protein